MTKEITVNHNDELVDTLTAISTTFAWWMSSKNSYLMIMKQFLNQYHQNLNQKGKFNWRMSVQSLL